MDTIPIFSGAQEDNLDSWITCGHFLSMIEDQCNKKELILTEENLKEICLSKLAGSALELFQNNSDQPWHELKNLLFQNFPVKLSIREKVEIRKKLQQQEAESIDDFYQRCLQAQYLVSDDLKDVGFEREVLLHFLIGLSPLIRDLVLATKCSSTLEYIVESKKYVQVVKEEPIEVNVKLEADPYNEELEYKSQYDAYGNSFASEDVFEEVENEDPVKKAKLLKTEKDTDLQTPKISEFGIHNLENDTASEAIKDFQCDLCDKCFTLKGNLKTHKKIVHQPGKIKCDFCEKTLKTKQTLRLHKQIKHNKCAVCEKTFVNQEAHYEKWHSELKGSFLCRIVKKERSRKLMEEKFDIKPDHKLEKCDTCGKECANKQSLKTHYQIVHKVCAKCGKTFVDKNKHYKLWHSDVTCKHCDYSCKDKYNLTIHMEKKHNCCQICSEVFESKEVRLDHEEKAHGHLKQTCEKCNSKFLTITDLASHLADKHCHKNSDGKFNCLYCKFQLKISRPRVLGYHILNKHFNQPLFPCSQCEKGFDTKRNLRRHIQHRHTDERAFQCDKCAKAFKTLSCLNIHVENTHKEQIEAKCLECNKTFKNERCLRTHRQIYHKGEKFVCQDCGKSFIAKANLRLHILSLHSDPTEKAKNMISCSHPGCDYSAINKSHLISHNKRVHLKKKNFQCPLCPKSFFSRQTFDEHTNGVHLNLKPYQCDKCEFATAYKATANEHRRVAHGNQRYDCPHCNHTARYKGNLDKHINNVHKNK